MNVGLIAFDHSEATSAVAPLNFIHIGFDEMDSATAAFFNIFGKGGIGNGMAVKTGSFVFDDNLRLPGVDGGGNINLFAGIETVAMLDGVHHRFFERETDGEDRLAIEPATVDVVHDFALDFLGLFVDGGDGEFEVGRAIEGGASRLRLLLLPSMFRSASLHKRRSDRPADTANDCRKRLLGKAGQRVGPSGQNAEKLIQLCDHEHFKYLRLYIRQS